MKKVTLLISIITILFLLVTHTTFLYADTTSFSFITKPQTILPSTPSQAVTIESEDASGTLVNTSETEDITFTSTSPTGQFLAVSGKSVSKTMSKGIAHKTFYYLDPTLGTYTLTVTVIGRVTKEKFVVSQQITVSNTVTPPTPVVTPKRATSQKPTKNSSVKNNTTATSSDSMTWPTSAQSVAPSSVATVYEAKPQTPVFDQLLDWPGKLWKWLKATVSLVLTKILNHVG